MSFDRFEYRYSAQSREDIVPPQWSMPSSTVTGGYQNRPFSKGICISLPNLRYRRIIRPFGISDLIINPSRSYPGDVIYISFQVANSSHSTSIYTVILKINGRIMAADVVSLPPRSVLPLSLSVVAESPGYYHVNVNDRNGSYMVYERKRREITRTAGRLQWGRKPAANNRILNPLTVHPRDDKYGKQTTVTVQDSIDNAGNAIELALDKLGDVLIFPITLLVKGYNRLRELF